MNTENKKIKGGGKKREKKKRKEIKGKEKIKRKMCCL